MSQLHIFFTVRFNLFSWTCKVFLAIQQVLILEELRDFFEGVEWFWQLFWGFCKPCDGYSVVLWYCRSLLGVEELEV